MQHRAGWRRGLHWESFAGVVDSNGLHGLTVADVDNDGRLDLVATHAIERKVLVMFNSGTSLVSLEGSYQVGSSPRNVVVADCNHDRAPDFATVNTNDGTVTIYFQNPAAHGDPPHFGNPLTITGVGVSPRDLAAVDADGDGVADLVVSDYGENRVLVLRNDGTGHFPAAGRVRLASAANPRTLAIGDFTEDGRPDILVGNQGSGTATLFINDSAFPGRP